MTTMSLIPTCDPGVWIEEQSAGYARYRRDDGRRWEVHGTCDKRGTCLIGAWIDGAEVTTAEHAAALAAGYTGPDCPVTPEFKGCCPFTFVELEPV